MHQSHSSFSAACGWTVCIRTKIPPVADLHCWKRACLVRYWEEGLWFCSCACVFLEGNKHSSTGSLSEQSLVLAALNQHQRACFSCFPTLIVKATAPAMFLIVYITWSAFASIIFRLSNTQCFPVNNLLWVSNVSGSCQGLWFHFTFGSLNFKGMNRLFWI